MHFFGIDFGTTNCSVAYVVDDPRQRGQKIIAVNVLPFELPGQHGAKSFRMPSMAYLDNTGHAYVYGWETVKELWKPRKSLPHIMQGSNFFKSVKSDMGSNKVVAPSGCWN